MKPILAIILIIGITAGALADSPSGTRRKDAKTHPANRASAHKQKRKPTHPPRRHSGEAQSPRAASAK